LLACKRDWRQPPSAAGVSRFVREMPLSAA